MALLPPRRSLPRVVLTAFFLLPLVPAQTPRPTVTAADYAHAVQYLGFNTAPLVFRTSVRPQWLPDGRFWYNVTTPQGTDFVLIDPARATREPAFDRARLATALSAVAHHTFDARDLPLSNLSFSSDGRTVSFTAESRRWICDRTGANLPGQSSSCAPDTAPAPRQPEGRGFGRGAARGGEPPESVSPDGTKAVFIRDWNLWLRDLKTKQVTQLTTDGAKNFGYATDNAGWTSSDRPIVLWSPDSKKIATYQQDQRGVGKLYLVPVVVGHPTLTTQIYPLPGDKVVTTIQRVIIDLPGADAPAKVIRLQMPPDQHRSSLRDDLAFGPDEDVQWSPDASHLAFISTSRDHKDEHLRVADAATGAVREVYEEKVATQYEGGQGGSNFRYLPDSNEFIWYSQRTGAESGGAAGLGQLYLYNLETGTLIDRITSPRDGNVDSVVHVDPKAREVWFLTTAVPGVNPYYLHLYRASFDGNRQQLLTPEDANHTVAFAPSGRWFEDTFSTPDTAPESLLRSADGRLVMHLEKADISRLLATGWQPPRQVRVKARDGQTDIYGLLFTPFHLEPGRKYPIINHIYPGPQTGSVGTRNFAPAHGDAEALAQLGFVVVELDGMGTPWRGRVFHDAYYGNMKDNTLPDQVAGMKELAGQYAFIDINRAGIYGHSGGGDATADAMFRYPDFFKVGIAESGNHDQREYEDDWGERYMGLDLPTHDGGATYTGQSNEEVARNLKGHLLLAHGTMDNNVPMNNTLLVVAALIKANKDFDLILLPNRPHGYGPDANYMMRRRWDYFERWLAGARPPHEFEISSPRRPPA